jgi:predicted PurR-regulated permease PerM
VEKTSINVTAVIVITLLVITAANIAQSVIEPVVFAIFIIALIWPLQKALQSRAPKAVALLVTVLSTLGIVIALSSMVAWGGREVADWIRGNLSDIQDRFTSSTKWLEEHDIFVLALVTEHFDTAWLINFFRVFIVRANLLVAFALLVFIYVIMGLSETKRFRTKIASFKDENTSRRLLEACEQIAKKFRKYMLVRTIASVATGFSVWGFAHVVGLELAAALGVLSFALNYLPYVGALGAIVFPALFAFVQFESGAMVMFVLIGLMVIRFVIGSLIEPIFSGSALAIAPPVVVFAIVLWTFLWGIPGTFIGVPLAIAFLTMCEQFPSSRWIATMLSGDSSSQRHALKDEDSELGSEGG